MKGKVKMLNLKRSTTWIIIVSIIIITVLTVRLMTKSSNDGIGDYDFYNFEVNGFMLGADTSKMDTSSLTPVPPLDNKKGYEFNFEEIRYSADEETGLLRKMHVNVYDGAYIPTVTLNNGEDAVYIPHNLNTIEQVIDVFGQGKKGWQDREQRLRYMEYHQKEGRLSATLRFVYYDGELGEIEHRLVWVIAESSLPYPYPHLDIK